MYRCMRLFSCKKYIYLVYSIHETCIHVCINTLKQISFAYLITSLFCFETKKTSYSFSVYFSHITISSYTDMIHLFSIIITLPHIIFVLF